MATALGTWQPTWIERDRVGAFERLTGTAQTVWVALCECPRFSRAGWRGSVNRIAARLRDIGRAIAWRTVRRAVRELVAAGFLAVKASTHRLSIFAAVRADRKVAALPAVKTAEAVDLSGPMDRDGNPILSRRDVDDRKRSLWQQIVALAQGEGRGGPGISPPGPHYEMDADAISRRKAVLLEQARRLARGDRGDP